MYQYLNESNTSTNAPDCDHYKIVRIFVGERSAEQVVADLIKVHLMGAE